jgi:biopolymer transport protein TolR
MMKMQRRRHLMAEINVVPYIDVMLVLLVIFMITAPLLTQGVTVNMPEADAKAIATADEVPLIVSVDKQGNYYLNASASPSVPMTSKALAAQVAAEVRLAEQNGRNRLVLVKGDSGVSYGKVVQAMVLLQHAGVSEIGLMTQQPDYVVA